MDHLASYEASDIDEEDVIVEVANDGGHLTLQFCSDDNDDQSSTYHASWLWTNDPQRVLLPSGQRSTTPGQWVATSRPRIKDATIVHYNIEEEKHGNYNNESMPGSSEEMSPAASGRRIKVPGPTLKDSCHPLAIYGNHPAWVSATPSTDDMSETNGMTRPYLKIVWSKPSASTSNEETTSIYDVEWLQRLQYDDASRQHHRRRTEVQPLNAIRKDGPPLWYSTPASKTELSSLYPEGGEIPRHCNDGLVHINYNSVIGDDGQILQDGLFRLFHSVIRDGAAIVSNTPMSHHPSDNVNVSELCQAVESMKEDELPVAKVAKAMSGGSLSHGSLYGNIFHVRVGERNSINVAYTSTALPPHQDMAYYESPPGMQLSHCVVMGDGVVGGESTLIDAMAAAHRLREVRPESFECLVKCPATFVKQRDGACMTYRRPHIVLAEEGGGGENTLDREIVAVHWSPPFEGPVRLPPGQVDRYYEAYADFERMLNVDAHNEALLNDELSQYAREYTWKHKLNPGDMLVLITGECFTDGVRSPRRMV